MIEKLKHLVDEVGALQSKLILLIGSPQSGKTALLHALAKSKGVTPLNAVRNHEVTNHEVFHYHFSLTN